MSERPAVSCRSGLVLPVAVLTVTVLAMTLADTVTQWRTRTILQDALDGQQSAFDQATRARAQFDAIARETRRLAAAGNENAKRVVSALQEHGITVNP